MNVRRAVPAAVESDDASIVEYFVQEGHVSWSLDDPDGVINRVREPDSRHAAGDAPGQGRHVFVRVGDVVLAFIVPLRGDRQDRHLAVGGEDHHRATTLVAAEHGPLAVKDVGAVVAAICRALCTLRGHCGIATTRNRLAIATAHWDARRLEGRAVEVEPNALKIRLTVWRRSLRPRAGRSRAL